MNIYSIAEECGVSVATVSRVINGRGGVGEQTRARVLAAMENHGFMPKITRNNGNAVCLFIANATPDTEVILSPYIKEFVNGMSSELFRRGWVFSMLPMKQQYTSANDFIMSCRQQGIAGAVVVNISKDSPVLEWDLKGFPTVLIDAGPEACRNGAYTLNTQSFEGSYEATCSLLREGHRRIVHITADLSVIDHIDRIRGYKKALEEWGVPFDEQLVIDKDAFDERSYSYKLFNLVKDPAEPVTAIFAGFDYEPIRVRSLLDEWGVRVPKDVSLIGFDDHEFSSLMNPPLTTVRQPLRQMGELSARLAMGLEPGAEHMFSLPTQMVVRSSVQRVGPSAAWESGFPARGGQPFSKSRIPAGDRSTE